MMQTVSGAYRLQVFDGDELVTDTDEFPNLITDNALAMGDPFAAGYVCVGTGSTAPAVSDAALVNELAAVSATFETTATIFMKGAERYAKRRVSASFTGIAGNISEVGFRGAAADSVRSRSLVRDGNGLVTVIPITASQTLKVSYFVYVLIPDELAAGVLTSPYGSSAFTIKPHEDLSSPAGIFAGRFNNPFAGVGLKALLSDGGSVNATVFSWSYDATTRTATATVNFAAIETNRTITGFEAVANSENLPVIELSTPLVNPAQNDVSFSLTFTWGRP